MPLVLLLSSWEKGTSGLQLDGRRGLDGSLCSEKMPVTTKTAGGAVCQVVNPSVPANWHESASAVPIGGADRPHSSPHDWTCAKKLVHRRNCVETVSLALVYVVSNY